MNSWETRQLVHEGFPLLLRFRKLINREMFQSKFPQLTVVSHKFALVEKNGLPNADYNDRLMSFDQAIRDSFEVADKGISVLVETFAGKRKYYFYTILDVNPQNIISDLSQKFPQESLSFSEHNDPHWSFITEYITKYFSN